MALDVAAELQRIDDELMELADAVDAVDASLGERLDSVRAGVKEAQAAVTAPAPAGADVAAPPSREIRFVYRNWRGEVALRRVTPVELRFAATSWHPVAQWLLVGVDEDRGERRDFALADILAWL